MKISHLLFGGLALAAASCSNDAIDDASRKSGGDKTFITLAASVNTNASAVRASSDQLYNYIGELTGKDEFGTVDAFIGSGNALEGSNGVIYKRFTTDYTASNNTYKPTVGVVNNAIEVLTTTPKQVNVLLNAGFVDAGSAIVDWLNGGGNAAGLTQRYFDTPYDLSKMDLTGKGVYGAAPATAVSQVAFYDDVAQKDKILMTSDDRLSYTVNAGVEADGTVADQSADQPTLTQGTPNSKNRFAREVRRVAARVYVTSKESSFEIKSGTKVLGTVSGLHFVIGQGERKIFIGQKRTKLDGSYYPTYVESLSNEEVRTPAFAYNSNTSAFDASAADKGAAEHYDYATLWNGTNGSNKRNTEEQLTAGASVVERAAKFSGGEADLSNLLNGSFFLGATHKAGNDDATSGYKKGNSTYVLVRGKFVPTTFSDDGKEVLLSVGDPTDPSKLKVDPTGKKTVAPGIRTHGDPEGTVYYTSNGEFFRTLEGAVHSFNTEWDGATPTTSVKYNVDGKTYIIPGSGWVKRYPAGKMLWTLWVNPDKPNDKSYNDPTVRNNIYAIHITGVSTIGENWNPLVPMAYYGDGPNGESGTNLWNQYTNKYNPDPNPNVDIRLGSEEGKTTPPDDPTTPNPNDPTNPPINPTDPTNPNNPNDPIPTDKIYMSVEAGVLPWQVHSYETTLK